MSDKESINYPATVANLENQLTGYVSEVNQLGDQIVYLENLVDERNSKIRELMLEAIKR